MDKKISQQPQKPERKKSKQPQLPVGATLDDELTDEQLRAVSGGHGAEHAPTNT